MDIFDGGTADFGIIDDFDFEKDYADLGYGIEFVDLLKKYNCISVPDDMLESWMMGLTDMPTYFGCYNRPKKGLARYAVTLIPFASLPRFIKTITEKTTEEFTNIPEYLELLALLEKAMQDEKFVIHFGV
jgi:hypothetical protein